MTNKEKYEIIKQFTNQKDPVGILGAFLIDDAYKDVEFVKYIKKTDQKLFFDIHPTIIANLQIRSEAFDSCLALLDCDKLSKATKEQITKRTKDAMEESRIMAGAAKELCETFDKVLNQ